MSKTNGVAAIMKNNETEEAQLTKEDPAALDLEASNGLKPIPKDEGFPWKKLLPCYFVTMSDSVALTAVTPFLPDICKERWGISEENVGIAAGGITGGYSLAMFCSSFLIGHISDVYGRKPLMLVGSGSGVICTFVFGLAPYYWIALAVRMLAGFLNGNNAISKAVASDVTRGQPQHRSLAFAYHGASFSLARALSSAMSGVLTGITLPLPLLDNPYMLPCVVGSIQQGIAFVMTMMCIKETIKYDGHKKEGAEKKSKLTLVGGLKEIAKDALIRNLIIMNCLTSFCNGSLLLAMILYFSLGIEYHGMGFTPLENGLAFGWFGLIALFFQVFAFKRLIAKLKIMKTFTFGVTCLAVGCFLFPFGGVFYWIMGVTPVAKVLGYFVMIVSSAVMAIGFMTGLPVVGTMLSNAAPPERQGLVIGTAQSWGSLIRSMGPTIGGLLFSFSVSVKFPFLLFWALTVIYVIVNLLSRRMSKEDHMRISGEVNYVELKSIHTNGDTEEEQDTDSEETSTLVTSPSDVALDERLVEKQNLLENTDK